MTVKVTEKLGGTEEECTRVDTTVAFSNGTEHAFEGSCSGACTKQAKREGTATLERTKRAVARGEASESELDYDFTGCHYAGVRAGRVDKVGAREVALVVEHYVGPHSALQVRYQVVLEICGKPFASQAFGERYVNGFELGKLAIAESPDHRQLVVSGELDPWKGVLYRLTFPTCPAPPVEEVLESG